MRVRAARRRADAAGLVLIAALAAVLLAVAACSPDEPSGACRGLELPEAAVNDGPGRWEEQGRSPELVELWRAGGLEEGQGMVLPVGIAAGPDGRAAVPDFGAGRVFVVGPDGGWRGTWTRQGDGPGEVLRPVAASWTEDGRLVVFDIQGSKVAWLSGPGEAADERRLPPEFTSPVVASGSLRWAAVGPDGTAWLRSGPSDIGPDAALAVDAVTRLRVSAETPDTVLRDTVPTVAARGRFSGTILPGAPRPTTAVTPEGDLAYASPDGRYAVHRLGRSDGRSETVLCREVEARPLRADERGEADVPEGEEEMAAAVRDAAAPARPAAIGRLVTDDRGRTWVQRKRPGPYGRDGMYGPPGGEWDVFAPDGAYLGSVEAPEGARIQAARGDTVWALRVGELDEVWIVAYELRR